MSFVSPVNGKSFGEDRQAYIYAVSRRESSSDLSLSDLVDPNLTARKVHNGKTAGYGFIGYFQFGESALYDLGYFKPPYTFSNDPNSLFQKSFSVNDWSGSWTGLDDVTSKSVFLKDRTVQIKAFNKWINTLCTRLNNRNVNEFYGVRINGVEITESGCIAGAHLKGPKYVLEFVQGLGNQADAFGTKVGEYISLFAHYDLESCCNRKIYINVVDEQGNAVSGKKIIVESEYKEGKYYSKIGKISNDYKTSEEGKIPVIVRHPGTKIKIIVDGKALEITQQKDKKESYTIKLTKQISVPVVLEQNSAPQPKPQANKTPQEVRNEQAPSITEESKAVETKDVNFNIQIVEADTGKPISNMGFFLTYKNNIKKHSADGSGIKHNISAEAGQDIEVSVSGDGKYQKIHHFKVEESLSNQTIKVRLPVHSFQMIVKKDDQIVPNTAVTIFYRGRQISKKTNAAGVINLKMLVGFVYGFGVGSNSLVKARVINGSPYRIFRINEGFIKESRRLESGQKVPQRNPVTNAPSQSKPNPPAPAKVPEVKQEPPKVSQQNTHTENGGKPLTTVSNQTPATSDTTRYHIYSDGKIKRENAAATGFAEYIYYDKNGQSHHIGKTEFIVAPKRKKGNGVVGGNVYLVDQRTLKSYKSPDGKVGYLWDIYLPGRSRYYLKGDAFAAVIGAMCSLGYGYYHGSGFSARDGRSVGSDSHFNGINGDFRYLGINGCHKDGPVLVSHVDRFDWDANVRFVNALYLFGYKSFGSQVMKRKGQPNRTLPHVTFTNGDHDNHLHLQGYQPNIQDI